MQQNELNFESKSYFIFDTADGVECQCAKIDKDGQPYTGEMYVTLCLDTDRDCRLDDDDVTGRMVLVIVRCKDGLLNDDESLPAVEAPGHREYWTNGLLTKVIAQGGDTVEYWKDGVLLRSEEDLGVRRSAGEDV